MFNKFRAEIIAVRFKFSIFQFSFLSLTLYNHFILGISNITVEESDICLYSIACLLITYPVTTPLAPLTSPSLVFRFFKSIT